MIRGVRSVLGVIFHPQKEDGGSDASGDERPREHAQAISACHQAAGLARACVRMRHARACGRILR